MRRSRIIMGTGVSVDIPNANEKVFDKVFQKLVEIDSRFSLYKPRSELNLYRHGEIKKSDLSQAMQLVMKGCSQAKQQTDGYFSADFEGQYNPTGYVKGWAINRVGEEIRSSGFGTFCIGIGGDILAASDSRKKWGIGITNPRDKKYLTSQVFIKNGAIATSGNYERGVHIINPKTGKPANKLASVTVIGPDIVQADVLATACFAAGGDWRQIMQQHSAYEALIIDSDNQKQLTAGMEAILNKT